MEAYLGIDVGSVTTKFAVLNDGDELVADLYLPTQGKPIENGTAGLKSNQKATAQRYGHLRCGYHRQRPLPGGGYRRG